MSFHVGRGGPRGRPAAPGQIQYRPSPPRYHYDPSAGPGPAYNHPGGSGYMPPPPPDLMPFHFPPPLQGSNALPQCPVRPPVFPEPPPFPPPAPHGSDCSAPLLPQSPYPYMMPPVTPLPLPRMPPPTLPSMPYPPSYPMSYPPQPQVPPPPNFSHSYAPPGGSFKPDHPPQYKADSCTHSPERLRHHDRHRGHGYGAYGGRERDRGRSPERRRSGSPRYKGDYDRGRVAQRHRSR